MKLEIKPRKMQGTVRILPSKSQLHRLLICAALSRAPMEIHCGETDAEDVVATIACLRALGAQISETAEGLQITPLDRAHLPAHCLLPCGESGSTLRFLLPVVAALGVSASFQMAGRLPDRPLAPLDHALEAKGITLRREGEILHCAGKLQGGNFRLPGNVSSQYISGMLFALPLLGQASTLCIEGVLESADYVQMTRDVQAQFGVALPYVDACYHRSGQMAYHAPLCLHAEGDWSNAAFWLCAGALSQEGIRVEGLNPNSAQGDKAVCDILKQMGAQISWDGAVIWARAGDLRAVDIDAAAIPDLVPVLACVAALAAGETRIHKAARLRLKESDRLASVAQTLHALGAHIRELPDGLCISGVRRLRGGEVDAWGDHRIAMMAAVAACGADGAITLTGAEAVRKSYPAFWQRAKGLGAEIEEVL